MLTRFYFSLFLTFPALCANITSIRLSQVDFYQNGNLVRARSGHGQADIAYQQDPAGVSYLNIVQTSGSNPWIVRNLPLLSAAETGTTSFATTLYYNLGVATGASISGSTVNFFYTITPVPVSAAPTAGTSGSTVVGTVQSLVANGVAGTAATVNPPPSDPTFSNLPASGSTTGFLHKSVPNVRQDPNGSGPGVATNTFLWLASEYGYQIGQTTTTMLAEIGVDMSTSPSTGTTDANLVGGLLKYSNVHKLPLEIHYAGGRGLTADDGGLPGATSAFIDPNGNGTAARLGSMSWSFLEQELQKGQALIALTSSHAVVIEGVFSYGSAKFILYRDDNLQHSFNTTAQELADLGSRHVFSSFVDQDSAGNPLPAPLVNFGNGTEPLHTAIAASPLPQFTFAPLSYRFTVQFPPPLDPGHHNIVMPPVNNFYFALKPDGTFDVFGADYPVYDAAGTCNLQSWLCTATGTAPVFGNGTDTKWTLQLQPPTPDSPLPQATVTYILGAQSGLFGSDPMSWTGTAYASSPIFPRESTLAPAAGDPVSTLSGEVTSVAPADLSLGGPLPLEFRRYYGSFLAINGIKGALGNNWIHNFDLRVSVVGANAAVITPRGLVIRFALTGSTWNLNGGYRLGYQLLTVSGGYRFLDPSDKRIYTFLSNGTLSRIEDRNGNVLTISPGPNGPVQVSDALGRVLTFSYDANNNLSAIQDQTGRSVSFNYTGGNLTGVTDVAGKVTSYSYSTLGRFTGLLTRVTLPLGNTFISQTFDATARATSQADGLGNTTALTFSASSTGTTTVRDARGNVTTLVQPDLHLLNMSLDANSEATYVTYDTNGRPIAIVDRNGNKTVVAYHDPSGYLASVTDAQGNTKSFIYTASTKNGLTFYDLTRVSYPDGASTSYTYDASGNVSRRTDGAGKSFTYTYDPRGQILTATNPLGGVANYFYNPDETLGSFTSPAGDTTSYGYDSTKRVLSEKYADGTSVNYVYDALDRRIQVTDERLHVTKASYDANGRIAGTSDQLSNPTSYTYDGAGNLTAVKDPAGTTSVAYNEVNLRKTVTAGAGETTNYVYDALNRVSSISDAAGPLRSFTYTREGAITSVTDGAKRIWTFALDPLGRNTGTTTPLGETWRTTFDKRGRVTSSTDPTGGVTAYAYDGRGLVSSVVLPGSIQAIYARNDGGQITSTVDPVGSSWTRAYDNSGHLTSHTDPLNRKVTFTYDARNRIASATNPTGSAQFIYDETGNLTQAKFSDKTAFSYKYDEANRLTSADGLTLAYDAAGRIVNSNGLAIVRDASGRISSIAYPSGRVTYGYNNRGLVAQVVDWLGGITAFTYDASLRLSGIVRPNGTSTQYTYDGNGKLSGISELRSAVLASITIQRDAAGKIVSENRTQPQAITPAPGTAGFTYDITDQIDTATYDLAGHLTKDASRTYTWDAASRLTSYQGSDGTASFAYDALNNRISRIAGDTAISYTINYALDLPSASVVRSGNVDQSYHVYLPNGTLLYSIDAATSKRRFYHFDELGNTIFLTDDNGAVTDTYGVSAYGESAAHTGNSNYPFTWQGARGVMQELGTSLFYLRARYYDSASARFLSRDPIQGLAPNEINPYQYALNNPVAFDDPTGLRAGQAVDLAPWSYIVSLDPADPAPAVRSLATQKAFTDSIVRLYFPLPASDVTVAAPAVAGGTAPQTLP